MDIPNLIDQLDEIIYLSDPDTYELIYVNRTGMQKLKLKSYASKHCYEVLQGLDKPCAFCTNHLLTEEKFIEWEHMNKNTGRYYTVKDKLVRLADGRCVRMEIAIDQTDKREKLENTRAQLETITSLVTCLRYLSPPNSFEDVSDRILGELCTFYDADRAYIIDFDYKANKATKTYQQFAKNIIPSPNELYEVDLDCMRPAVDILRNHNELRLVKPEELCNFSSTYKLFEMHEIKSWLAAPLYIKDEMVGLLAVDNPQQEKAELLESLAFFIVSDLKKQRIEKELDHTRSYDSLTALKNHASYMEYLDELRNKQLDTLGVVVADINALKYLNMRYGPVYGDTYIVTTAQLLEQTFPEAKVFRIGGDEFCVLCENMTSIEFKEAVILLEHLLQKEDFTVSIGHTWSEQQIDVDEMTNYADHMLSIHKQDFYCTHADLRLRTNSLLQEDFLTALKEGQFLPYLQPKANTSDGKLVGAEMLVRRLDPIRGIIPPIEFIPRLEKEGLIKHLDFYMITQACALLARWNKEGKNLICVSVNVSRVTLMEPDFITKLMEIQNTYDFPRNYLELEVTERVGKIERETLLNTASGLRKEGFCISLDDFGAEYSNLSLLTAMDMDVVKLDKSLIDDVDCSQKSAALAECIVKVCHSFGMKCIAEGVETDQQLGVLREMQCDDIQGYLLSPPIAIDAFEEKYAQQLIE